MIRCVGAKHHDIFGLNCHSVVNKNDCHAMPYMAKENILYHRLSFTSYNVRQRNHSPPSLAIRSILQPFAQVKI